MDNGANAFQIGPMAALFSLSRDAVLGVQDGRIAFMNQAAAAAVGGDRTGAPGSSLLPEHLLHPQAESFAASAVIAKKKATVTSVLLEGMRIFLINFDLGDRDEGVFTALAPLIRTVLSNVKISTEMLASCAESFEDKRAMRYAAVLNHSYHQLRRLLLNISVATAIDQGNMPFIPAVTDVTEICRKLVALTSGFAENNGICLEFDDGSDSCEATVDSELVNQMFMNVLSNSLGHTERGGRVRVTVTKNEENLIISVDDNGTGIPPEVMPTVFSRWTEGRPLTDASSGAGLGLYVSRRIAEFHGGALIIESRKDRGTCVRIMLPVHNRDGATVKSAGFVYRVDERDAVMTQLSTWLPSREYGIILNDR